jgi:midasin (ATPase involved in ribosome maturation)
LPKSFLNRFTKIFLDDLLIEDYRVILKRQASDVFDEAKVESLLRVTARAGALTKNNPNADHSSVNMRDLSRFMTLYRSYLA